MGDHDENLLFGVWLLSRVATRVIDEAIRDSGLTADEFAVYSLLCGGPRTPGELAGWLAVPPTTVSSYVKRFERRGHVRRRASPDDGRSYLLVLTPSGRAAHRRAGTAFLELLDSLRGDLGAAEERVQQALTELRTVLSTRAPLAATSGTVGIPDGSGPGRR